MKLGIDMSKARLLSFLSTFSPFKRWTVQSSACLRLIFFFVSYLRWTLAQQYTDQKFCQAFRGDRALSEQDIIFRVLSYFFIFVDKRNRVKLLTLIIAIMKQDSIKPRTGRKRTPPKRPPKKPPKRSAPYSNPAV